MTKDAKKVTKLNDVETLLDRLVDNRPSVICAIWQDSETGAWSCSKACSPRSRH